MLRIKTLGGLLIERDGEHLDNLASRKAEALLVYLACTGRAHPREVLADLFWDGRTQRQAMANLRVVLSSLRKEAGAYLAITRTTACVEPDSDLWLDAAQMEEAVVAAREAGGLHSRADAKSLAEALALYEGDFLAGYFLPDAASFESWAVAERERLHRLVVDGLQRLGRWALGQGDQAAAITWASRLVEVDPLVEAGHRQLMEALARNGQRAAALAQYEQCRKLLRDELDLEPQAETQALNQAIQKGRLTTAGAPAALWEPAEPVFPKFLTSLRTSPMGQIPFLRRERAVERFEEELERALEGGTRALFVSGEAGTGKTALVREFTRRATDAEPELVVAVGYSRFLGAGESAYQPFRQILAMLAGDVEEAMLAGVLSPEAARRLWALMPHTAQALISHGHELAGVLVNGRAMLERLAAALPKPVPWSSELERIAEWPRLVPGEVDRGVLHEQYAAVLQALAKKGPLLLLLEDLHWADAATLALLFHLGQRPAAAPILLVGTFRPEEVGSSTRGERPMLDKVLAEFKRTYGSVVVDLDEIVTVEARVFIDGLLRAEKVELDESFREGLLRHTGGHPLFTIELLRAMRERGDLQREEDGSWQIRGEMDWSELPGKVEGVLEERLRRLEPLSRRILAAAAVEGELFTAQVAAKALGREEREVVRHLSDVLERGHRLVQSWGTQRLGKQRLSRYSFRHVLFWHYLYGSLDEAERGYLHEDVGSALEELYEGATETVADQMAWHFREAGLPEKGLNYSLLAGDRARQDYAFESAAEHYEDALAIFQTRDDPALAARTLMKLGLTYHLDLQYRQARRAFEEGFATWQRAERKAGREALSPATHTFRAPYAYEPETLDPTGVTMAIETDIAPQLFSRLTAIRGEGEIAPDVAAAWEMMDGGRRYPFHLREDVRWSDGRPVTAEDFVLAWTRLLDPQRAGHLLEATVLNIKGAASYRQGEIGADRLGVGAADRHMLIVELEQPSGDFLMAHPYPVPAHAVRRYGDAWTSDEHLISNGPYKLVAWRRHKELVFERNPLYHGSYEGNVQRVELKIIDSWSEALELYEESKLDVLPISALDATPIAFQRVRQSHASEYVSAPWLQTTLLAFDLEHEPFQDPRVRRALALAVDRNDLADVELGGMFFPAGGGLIPQGMAGHTAGINPPYDPQQARDLLAEAGFPGGRGFPDVRAKGPATGLFPAMRAALEARWRDVLGLGIRLEATDWGHLMEDVQLYLTGWLAGYNRDPGHFLDPFAPMSGIVGKNAAFDHLLEQARETPGQQERLAIYQRADRLLVEEAMTFPLLYGRAHYLVKPWLRRYRPTGMGIRWKDLIIDK